MYPTSVAAAACSPGVLVNISKLNPSTNPMIVIENPCILGIAMGPNGKASLQMQPMLLFSDQKVVEIKPEHVLYNVSVAIEIKNKYNEIYGSGIVVPPQQSIII